MVDDIEQAVLGRGSCGWPHHEVVRIQVLEEVDSAGVEVVVAPHLDELSTWVNAHLLVPVTLHDNLLWFVAQFVQEHGLDYAIVDEYFRVASTLLVVLGHTCVVCPKLRLRGLRSEEDAIQGCLGDGLQTSKREIIHMLCINKILKCTNNATFYTHKSMFHNKQIAKIV